MSNKIRIGAFISGGGSNLNAIIDACEAGQIDGEVVFVGSDNKDAKGLKKSSESGYPTFVVDYNNIVQKYNDNILKAPDDFNFDEINKKQSLISENKSIDTIKKFLITRACAENEIIENIKKYNYDLIVLAGFMRVFTPYFIDRINNDKQKIMNIHPALLPAFPGVDGYGDTFRYGCKIGGCTVHFIDYGEDTGPIIGQKAFEILPEDTLDSVKEKGLKLEWELFPECIQLFAENKC
ncbi:MAG: phosphoribosylglycinamide formyltransferase [Desulfobacterales bacterium]|nr:phosphoribosylglycinamide formyltransferase [Desulfobacterales bacterium]MCP4160999.1 phosphoribosylglycinamide formyltransferase [Deltaproteobacteria bacterium]